MYVFAIIITLFFLLVIFIIERFVVQCHNNHLDCLESRAFIYSIRRKNRGWNVYNGRIMVLDRLIPDFLEKSGKNKLVQSSLCEVARTD